MKRFPQALFRFGSGVLLALSAALTARADYPATVVSQAPPVYYRLNETVQPAPEPLATNLGSLGAAANGTFVALPAFNAPGPFTGSVSVGLDGSSQYIDTPYVAGLNTSNFTFEVWANAALVPNFAYLASSVEINGNRSGWYLAQDNGSTFHLGSAYVVRFFNQNANNPTTTLWAPIVDPAGTWMHLALTYDGTTATLYTNGVAAMSTVPTGTPTAYVPNVDAPFTVGIRSSLNFEWAGNVAEAAMYSSALSATRVAAHFTAAKTAPATYAATVLADAPLLYDRYQAPPNATIANSGALGSAYNGLLLPDAHAGSPGPRSPTYPGFDAANNSISFDAKGGAAQIPALNFNTNTITISGWVNAAGAQEAGAGIVVCDGGTTGGGLIIDGTFGGLGLGYYWNNDPSTFGWSPNSDAGLPLLPNADWAFVALVVQPTEADIYIASPSASGPITFQSVTNYYTHVNMAFEAPTLIGTDAGNPTYSFSGSIDEVGVWNRALASGELYTQYGSAVGGLAPIVFSDPPSPSQPIVAGDTLSLTVNVGGTPNLSYQWLLGGVPLPAPAGTNSIYVKPNFSIAGDSGNYSVIITNNYGMVTSGVAVVTGQLATAPVVTQVPVGGTIYPGGVLNLSVAASGGGLVYQWETNGTPIPGATQPTYVVASVSITNAGTYTVSITNSLGATNVGPAVVVVPVLVSNTYAAVVDADAPEAWWRLDETAITNGTILADAMGRHSGAYTNAGGLSVGQAGAIAGPNGGTAITFTGDQSYGYIPYFSALSSTKCTFELWAKQATVDNGVSAASDFDSTPKGFGIGAESYWQGQNGNGNFGSAPGTTAGYDPTIRAGQWVHLVILYNPGSDATYPWQIYVNGVTDGFIWGDGGTGMNDSQPLIIGGYGTGLSTILKSYFVGSVDEVAFYNKLLTSSQIQAHYNAAPYGTPPTFTVQPQSQDAFAGQNASFSASTVGALPITLQWKKNGVSLPGQTNAILTVSNLFYTASSDVYSAVATNAFGSAVSSNAVVTVYYPPTFANLTNELVLHLTFDGNYNDTSGRGNNGTAVGSPTLVPGKIGSQAVTVSTDTTNTTYNYVTLGTPSDFQFGSSVDFSVSYWVKMPAGELPGDEPFLCSAANSTGGFGVTIAPAYKTGGWAWSIDNSGATGAGVQGPAATINDGNWHNVVEVFSRASNAYTYLDGALVNTTPIAGIGSIDSGLTFNIGQDPTGTYGESAIYSLDDMGVWRRALTDIEAESIYIVGQNYGKSFDAPGAVTPALYPLSGGKLGIAWQTGKLLQSPKVNGPWTPVPNATVPFFQFTPSSTNTFYGIGQ